MASRELARREMLKLGGGAGAVILGGAFGLWSRPVGAGPFSTEGVFNAIDTRRILLLASAEDDMFLRVEVLTSKTLSNGDPQTSVPESVLSNEPNGVWPIAKNQTSRIRIPVTGVDYDFTNGGFAAVLARSVDAGGALSAIPFIGQALIARPRHVTDLPGAAAQFRLPLLADTGGQSVQVCMTPENSTTMTVKDRLTNTVLVSQPALADHSFLFEFLAFDSTQLEMTFSGGERGSVSVFVTRSNGARYRAYPIGL